MHPLKKIKKSICPEPFDATEDQLERRISFFCIIPNECEESRKYFINKISPGVYSYASLRTGSEHSEGVEMTVRKLKKQGVRLGDTLICHSEPCLEII